MSVVDLLQNLVAVFERLLAFLSTWPGAFVFILVFIIGRRGVSNAMTKTIPDLLRKGVEVFSEVGIGPKGVNLKFKDTAIGKTQVTVTFIPDSNVYESYSTYTSGAGRFQIGWPSKDFLCPEESKRVFEERVNQGIHDGTFDPSFPKPDFVLLAKASDGQAFQENVNICIDTLPGPCSINQYLRSSLQNLRKTLGVGDFDFASVDERAKSALVQFNYSVLFSNASESTLLTSIQRMVISNGLAYQITVTQPTASLSDYGKQVMYRNILNSFVLLSSGR